MWRSSRGLTVCHVYRHENNESSNLFESIRKDKVGMINNLIPITGNVIFYTDKIRFRTQIISYTDKIR